MQSSPHAMTSFEVTIFKPSTSGTFICYYLAKITYMETVQLLLSNLKSSTFDWFYIIFTLTYSKGSSTFRQKIPRTWWYSMQSLQLPPNGKYLAVSIGIFTFAVANSNGHWSVSCTFRQRISRKLNHSQYLSSTAACFKSCLVAFTISLTIEEVKNPQMIVRKSI